MKSPAVPSLLVVGFFLMVPTAASSQEAACLGPSAADTLVRVADRRDEARALWLDGRQILWPGAPAAATYALYRSANGSVQAVAGEQVRGADARLPLTVATDGGAVPPRFRWAGTGVRLALPALGASEVRRLLREQLVLVREGQGARVQEATLVQVAGALDDVYAAAGEVEGLGVSWRGARAHLALWAPTARRVVACLHEAERERGATAVAMTLDSVTGTWHARLPATARGRAYRYLVEVFVPAVGIVRNRVTDPYAVALTANSSHSVVLSLDDQATQPVGWSRDPRPAPLRAPVDQVVYELHVRDFSAQDTTVRAAWRGRYLAFTTPGSRGMRHLRALRAAGVTDVHLLPVFDLSTVPESGCVEPSIPEAAPDAERQQASVSAVRERDCFNWGYDPWHYTVPEGSYATDADAPATRIREFRAMVLALHQAGLRVGMDVVYNHTFASGQSAQSVLDRIVPGYYHRLDAQGRVTRSTCCENTATEHRMMAKLMIESVVTWVRAYHVDAFRFDLMGHQPREAMERLQRAVNVAAGRPVPLLGEGWNFGEVADGARFVQASQRSLPGSGIATFSDRARDALRGGGCCDSREGLVANQGVLNGLHLAPNERQVDADSAKDLARAMDLARAGLAGTLRDYQLPGPDGIARPLSALDYAGQPAGYATSPAEVVNYVENHDNLTLFDVNAFRLPRATSSAQRARAQVLGIAFTLLSQGVAYLHAGVDILRSKSLDRDSFDSGDWFNRLDWTYTANGFGGGLPPAHRNRDDWPVMQPVLADRSIVATPADIAFARDATRDLLRIRASSTLFRLRTAADVQERLQFWNTGPGADAAVVAGHLQGRGYPGAGFREVLYLINVAPDERTVVLPQAAGRPWRLHPIHRSSTAADCEAARVQVDVPGGRFAIPGRTAVVLVLE